MKILWLLSLILVAAMDFQFRKVKNHLIVFLFLIGILNFVFSWNPFLIDGISGFSAAVFFLVIFIPFYALKWMGAGDVKFLVVLGIWLGLTSNLMWTLLLGSIFSCLYVAWSYMAAWIKVICPQIDFSLVDRHSGGSPRDVGRSSRRFIPYAGHLALANICIMLLGV